MPFNMYTFNKMWGSLLHQSEAQAKIEEQKKQAGITEPKNLEEQAISLVGTDIYEKLIKGYTMKQWGRPCDKLPSSLLRDCRFDLLLIIIILMHFIRGFR